jgi:4-amino-4-deoxy-L-arabinose transferase-like glycosyltransferase
MRPAPKSRWFGLIALLSAAVGLLSVWSVAVPMYEAPDELQHWQYLRYVNEQRRLPYYQVGFEEANSPPFYYLLLAPFAVDTPEPPSAVVPDGAGGFHFPAGAARFKDSRPGIEGYGPMRVVRLLTGLLSVFTVLFCYLAGREATGRATTGLLSGGLVLLLPMFTFRGMNISNDAPLVMFCAAFTYGCVRLVRRGWTWPSGITTVVFLAAAFLTKTSAIVLAPMFGLVVMSVSASWGQRLERLSAILLIPALAAPWLWRNVVLYGDLLASRQMYIAVPHLVHEKSMVAPYLYTQLPARALQSFVGEFGWMSLVMPSWIYWVFAGLALATAAGLMRGWHARLFSRRLVLVLAPALPLSAVFLYYINLRFDQPQGRYLFPALASMGVLAALGCEALPGWRRMHGLVLLGALLALNIFIVVRVVIPAY